MIRNLPTLPEYAKKIFNSGPFLFFVHPSWQNVPDHTIDLSSFHFSVFSH
jgi:hypothetical protein